MWGYLGFHFSFLFDGICAIALTSTASHEPSPHACFHAISARFLFHFIRVAEALWLTCICHSINNELTDALAHFSFDSARTSRDMTKQYQRKRSNQLYYHGLSWGVPTGLFIWFLSSSDDVCDFGLGKLKLTGERMLDQWFIIALCGINFIFFAINARKARYVTILWHLCLI
jgi:hypothetical protein